MENRIEELFEEYRLQKKTLSEVKAGILLLFSVSTSTLLNELLRNCKEVYGMSGLRISCITENEIKQVFEKHGIKYEPPF